MTRDRDESAMTSPDTMAEDTPFVLTRVTCPVCRTVNEYECVKAGAYTESGFDTDFRPLGRRWANPRYQWVNPLLYFMATCTSCFYTRELTRASAADPSDPCASPDETRSLRQRHLGSLTEQDSSIRRLGDSLWAESYPIPTAINKLALGILSEHLLEHPSDYDLARWYLRVAWLFRELGTEVEQDATAPHKQSRRDLMQAIAAAGEDVKHLAERCHEISQFLLAHPESVQIEFNDQDTPARFCRSLATVSEQVERLAMPFGELRTQLQSGPGMVVGLKVGRRGEPYGEHASYVDFLKALRMDTPAVPTNEEEAMALSLGHYRRAFETQGRAESGHGPLVTAYMIGELSRRLRRWDDAERFLGWSREAALAMISEQGPTRPNTALARHIAALAELQLACAAKAMNES